MGKHAKIFVHSREGMYYKCENGVFYYGVLGRNDIIERAKWDIQPEDLPSLQALAISPDNTP